MSIEDHKGELELCKLRLDIKRLQSDASAVGVFARQLWPIVSTVLTVLLSVTALYVSISTQNRQMRLQQEQVHHQLLQHALELATDGGGAGDRRVAGIWQLGRYWQEEGDRQVLASTLAAELALPDELRMARCAAAEVIGSAMSSVPAAARPTLARILFGSARGELGIVVQQQHLLRSGGADATPSSACLTALDATREAIRKNWLYLRDVNLNGTDLSAIEFYAADGHGSLFIGATLTNANFRCANLFGAVFDRAVGWQAVDWTYANVRELLPTEVRAFALANGALDMPDAEWEAWRTNGFRLAADGQPSLLAGQGTEARCLGA